MEDTHNHDNAMDLDDNDNDNNKNGGGDHEMMQETIPLPPPALQESYSWSNIGPSQPSHPSPLLTRQSLQEEAKRTYLQQHPLNPLHPEGLWQVPAPLEVLRHETTTKKTREHLAPSLHREYENSQRLLRRNWNRNLHSVLPDDLRRLTPYSLAMVRKLRRFSLDAAMLEDHCVALLRRAREERLVEAGVAVGVEGGRCEFVETELEGGGGGERRVWENTFGVMLVDVERAHGWMREEKGIECQPFVGRGKRRRESREAARGEEGEMEKKKERKREKKERKRRLKQASKALESRQSDTSNRVVARRREEKLIGRVVKEMAQLIDRRDGGDGAVLRVDEDVADDRGAESMGATKGIWPMQHDGPGLCTTKRREEHDRNESDERGNMMHETEVKISTKKRKPRRRAKAKLEAKTPGALSRSQAPSIVLPSEKFDFNDFQPLYGLSNALPLRMKE